MRTQPNSDPTRRRSSTRWARRSACVCVLIVLAATAASAHYKFRIVGTVAKITAEEIAVKQVKDGVVVEMDHDKKTKITRDKKTVGRDQIKVGGSVVIDALGDD